jgi:hypothetical protein
MTKFILVFCCILPSCRIPVDYKKILKVDTETKINNIHIIPSLSKQFIFIGKMKRLFIILLKI